MAPYAFDLIDEEKKKKEQEQQAQGEFGAPAMTGGGGSFTQGASPSQEKGANQQGSGFVNLDNYLNANKGSNFGSKFTGNVQSSVDTAKGAINQGADQFSQASNQGATKWSDVQPKAQGMVSGAGDNTSQADADQFKAWSNASYQGPESFNSTAWGTRAQGAAQKAGQEAKALGTEGGRFALLEQYFGRPTYNTGQKTLDNALVQNTPGVAAKAQNLGNQAGALTSQYGQTAQSSNNLAASNRAATQDTAKNSKDLVSQARSDFGTDLQGRYDTYKADTGKWNDARRADIGDDTLDDDTRKLYGLNSGDSLYNVDLSKYLTDSPTASVGQFASDADYARYLALEKLAGEEPSGLLATDRAKAGSGASMGKVGVDTSRLKSDIASAQSGYASQNDSLNSQINQAQQQAAKLNDYITTVFANGAGNVAGGGNTGTVSNKNLDAALAQRNALLQQLAQYKAQQEALARQYDVGRTVR